MDWLLKEYFPLKQVDRYLWWALGLCALVLYLALPVRVISYDSLAYAIETTSDIARRHFHPHHLLFSRTHNFSFFTSFGSLIVARTLLIRWFGSTQSLALSLWHSFTAVPL